MKLLKKFLCTLLSAAMITAAAASPSFAADDISVTLDGRKLSFDVPPQIINERTMVPLRAIFEALGADVDWNQATQTVTSSKDDITIRLTIDSNIMYVNGNTVVLDTPACVVNERTLVPVRAISEAFNTTVDWDNDTRTVIISSQPSNSQTNPFEYSTPETRSAFEKLKNKIVSDGEYSSKYNSYTILIDGGAINTMISYKPEDEVILMSSFYISKEISTDVMLAIYKNEIPGLLMTVEGSTVTREFYGMFPASTHKLTEMKSSLYSFEEDSAMDIINLALELYDTYIQSLNLGITLKDFGVLYDKV